MQSIDDFLSTKCFNITHAISNFFVADMDVMRINLSIQVFCLQIIHVKSKIIQVNNTGEKSYFFIFKYVYLY